MRFLWLRVFCGDVSSLAGRHLFSDQLPPVSNDYPAILVRGLAAPFRYLGLTTMVAIILILDSAKRRHINCLLAALNQLRNIFGLGKWEAKAITLDVTSKVYRQKLAQAVSGGDFEMADSKAAFMKNFECAVISFLNLEIFLQKLQQLVAGGELRDKDAAALLRSRVMLCIPQQTVEAAHSDICGSLSEKDTCAVIVFAHDRVVKDAIASGVNGYDGEIKKSVRKAAHGLRLNRDTARSIASKAVRKIFINYIKPGNRTESAKELRKIIAFNTLVVTELMKDIKGESDDESNEEELGKEEMIQTEDEEWDSL
ncbi:Protein TIC110, chloroplastic, partial [Mucuna pruriens]